MSGARSHIMLSTASKECLPKSMSPRSKPPPTGPLLHTAQVAVKHQIGTAFSCCFQGANGTPFLPPLLHCVGMDGSSTTA